ncbi:MAG: hypothetical protein RLZZ427_1331 [Pseudomonadota bacterium]|jgi:regulator of CtrA degradation
MAKAANLNPRIIEGLYCDALVLSDEVRARFTQSRRPDSAAGEQSQIALSCEGLRTTTRMMHAVAWLLNHRAFLNGELSEGQLRRHGSLPTCPDGDPERIALLDPETRTLIHETERFHARLKRIDNRWRGGSTANQRPC